MIQNEINEREFYHLAKSLLWNKYTDIKCKITIFNIYLKRYYYMEQRHRHVVRDRKVNYKQPK
jgi:hypothetical protein